MPIDAPRHARLATLTLLLALPVLAHPGAAQQMIRCTGPDQCIEGPPGIPGLSARVDPPTLVLVQGQRADLRLELRNDGNATLNLTLDPAVHDPPQMTQGGGGPSGASGPGPKGEQRTSRGPDGEPDANFTATLSPRTLQMEPGATVNLTMTVQASPTAANGTRKTLTLMIVDQAQAKDDRPPPAQPLQVPLRIRGQAPREGAAGSPPSGTPPAATPAPPRDGSTGLGPGADDPTAIPGVSGVAVLAALAGAATAAGGRRRNGKP